MDLLALESALPLFSAGLVRAALFEWGPTERWQRMAAAQAAAGEAPPNQKERARALMTAVRDEVGASFAKGGCLSAPPAPAPLSLPAPTPP